MTYIFTVALCAACISYTITRTSIFKWLREIVETWHPKLEELIHCPYCFAHYVVLTIMFTTKDISSKLIHINGFVVYDFLFTWFCIVCLVCLIHYIMLLAYKPVAESETFRRIRKNKENNN